jgi:hypothetical protein
VKSELSRKGAPDGETSYKDGDENAGFPVQAEK